MTLDDFVTRVIDDGIAAARADYRPGDQQLDGSIAGFEACRGQDVDHLALLLQHARQQTLDQRAEHPFDLIAYWWTRCFEAEVEWVCNCVSAVLVNEGRPPIAPTLPTVRAMFRAAAIVGVRA